MNDKTKNWKNFKKEKENELFEEKFHDEWVNEDDDEKENALEAPNYADLEEKLTLAEQKAHENWEKSVRAVAELENVRRRAERDVTNAHRYSLEKMIVSLLPVIDSLEQALQLSDKETHGGMAEGLELTLKLFLDVLEKHEVRAIDPLGAMFDPQEHEAMSMVAAPHAESNSIVTVFQKGYKLHDRVIRPARVIVAKNP